jgi:hypothetical protein
MASGPSWRERFGPDGPALLACAGLIAWSLLLVAVNEQVIVVRWIFWLTLAAAFVAASAVWSIRNRRAEEEERRRRKRPFRLDESSGTP